jgi:hypothetical protein
MPRRRKRKTNWKRQEERALAVRGVRRGTPDAKKLSRAFIGLALARAEVEAQAQAQEEAEPTKRMTDHHQSGSDERDRDEAS